MKYANKYAAIAAGAALLSSCGSFDGVSDSRAPKSASAPKASGAVKDFPRKIGAPYQVGGKTYTPQDAVNYDQVGYASFYGRELAGRSTANGELFNPQGVSGAHKTLPLPTYVEVTALDTGRTILVRVNDRGPFANDRLIDLSEGAARQLGILEQGVAGVRVRKVTPPEQERAVLRNGLKASERIATPDSLLKILRNQLAKLPKPVSSSRQAARPVNTPVASSATRRGEFIREGSARSGNAAPVRSRRPATPGGDGFIREGTSSAAGTPIAPRVSGGYVVQIASFSSRARADALARKIGAKVMPSANGTLFRVRFGPYANEAEAQQGVATAKQRGYPNAKIFRR